jgi:hypothetical protein
MGETGKQADVEPRGGAGWWQTIGGFLSNLPVVGSYFKTFFSANVSVQRWILLLILILVVYPVFVMFAGLFFVGLLPDPERGDVRDFILTRLEFDQRSSSLVQQEHGMINTNNEVLDGSALLQFSITDYPQQLYIYDFVNGQHIEFYAYEIRDSRTDLPAGCSDKQADLTSIAHVGQLTVTPVDNDVATTADIPMSFDHSKQFFDKPGQNFDDSWKQWGTPGTRVTLKIAFSPTPDTQNIVSRIGKCERFDTYIVMRYSKPPLATGGK